MSDAQSALAQVREALEAMRGDWLGDGFTKLHRSQIVAVLDGQAAEIEQLRAALKTCVWALRQPLDGWKGECERKALDEARRRTQGTAMSMEYVRRTYGVPGQRGALVSYIGQLGLVTSATHHVRVRILGERRVRGFHPFDLHWIAKEQR